MAARPKDRLRLLRWLKDALAIMSCSGLVILACDSQPVASDVIQSDSGPSVVTLVSHEAWVFSSEKDDPMASYRPDELVCEEWAYRPEDGAFEVDTGVCNYLSVEQPSLAAVEPGDILDIALWHQSLVAPSGQAHLAILIGGYLIWEKTVDIPSYPAAYSPQIAADRAYPTGTPIVFHLHNHGSNNWQLLHLKRRR